MKFDVVIIGGGIAGSLAAVACARMGVKTLLVEEKGCLGGSLTSSGTGPMMTFHAGETQVIQGLAEEMVQNLIKKGFSIGHIPDSTGYTYTVTPFDCEGLKFELECMVLESGADLLYHSVVSDLVIKDDILEEVKILSCGKRFDIKGDVFVDASGDGDLLYQAGIPFRQGRSNDGKDQPMTMNMKLDHVDIDAIRELMDTHVELFPYLAPKAGLQKTAERLSCSGFQQIMREGQSSGEISFDRDIVLFFETNTRGEVIVNMSRINDLNPVDPLELSLAESEGRRQVWQLYAYLKKRVPGFSQSRVVTTGPNIGIRSSRTLIGDYTITVDDILTGRKFPDGIAACGYPVDIHSSDGVETHTTFLPEGMWYTIPYRCMINDSIQNVITSGRAVSSTFEAQASLRVSPCCGALGHASGVAAALSAAKCILPTELDVQELRMKLKEQGAFLG